MVDQTPGSPGNDPLGERLRATFEAEHAEVERRLLARSGPSGSERNLRWIPLVAAAAIAIAGLLFVSTRGGDNQAVELDVAAQPTQPTPPDTDSDETTDPDPTTEPVGTAVVAPVESVQALPGTPIHFESGVDLCPPGVYNDRQTVVWNAGDRPVTPTRTPRDTTAGGHTRELSPGTTVELTGGCVQVATPTGEIAWYELDAPEGDTDWVYAGLLVTPALFEQLSAPTSPPTLPTNGCGEPLIVAPFRFIWGVEVDDPDGGLIAHTEVGVDAPITRIIRHDEVVVVTGQCELSSTGSQWRELRAADGSLDWVSGRYLREPVGGCLAEKTSDGPGPVAGLAIFDGERVAFATPRDQRYQLYPAASITPAPCGPTQGTIDCPAFGPLFVWDVAVDDPDGGLLTHTIADVDAPIVRVLRHDQADIAATGRCTLSASGSLWRELATGEGTDWASGNFLAHPVVACLTRSDTSPSETGWAVADEDRVAFAPLDASAYEWFPTKSMILDQACEKRGPFGPVCLSGDVRIIDATGTEQSVGAVAAQTAWTTGRDAAPFLEVNVVTTDNRRVPGLVDPQVTDVTEGHCISLGDDSLASQPCTRVAGADRTAGIGTDEAGRTWTAGDNTSTADHVHDLRAESNGVCTRLVVEFGTGPETDDRVAAELPAVAVEHGLNRVKVRPAGAPWQPVFDDPTRVDYDDGIGLVTLSFGYEFAVEFMHRDLEPHVRFMSNPARVVIDLFPRTGSDLSDSRPYGEAFVLRQPIQQDLTGEGIPRDNDIVVAGFGRPFEASGLYRIWAVPDDVDAAAFLADPPDPLIENFFPTGGWAEGWGEFAVDLPELKPGSYIAVFGELPPTDEIGFYGTGQLFRVVESPSDDQGPFPEAVLLPDVRLPPEPG